jgi:bifunctional non-homologous end joining protein LigD
MLLSEVQQPFSRVGWGFEIKYDGWRCLAEVKAGAVRLQSRGGADATGWWPEVAVALAGLRGHHVLDGEMCVLDEYGRSDFDRLQVRSMRKGWKPGADLVVFCAFDVLVLSGRNVMQQPLRRRKASLGKLLEPVRQSVLPVGYVEAAGKQLYAQALALELEGIVAKDLESPYVPGVRSDAWVKFKRPGAVPAERFKFASR